MDDKKKTAIAFLLAALVLFLSGWGLNKIGERRREDHVKFLVGQLLGESGSVVEERVSPEEEHVTRAFRGETGYAVETTVPGYVDDIVIWTAVDFEGRVTDVTIRTMHETRGLGRRARNDRTFLEQFLGTDGYAQVGAGIDGITGATVTSRAVAAGINSAATYVSGEDGLTEATEWEDEE